MVDVVIVGTMAFDDIKTPFGSVEKALGGSATYAAFAASFFSKPGIVSVVGEDFPQEYSKLLQARGVDLGGVETVSGKTFYWKGEYGFDVNAVKTLSTELNVLQEFDPKLPASYKSSDFVFLGNIDPDLQLNVLRQMQKKPKLVIADTMNYWIESKREKVLEVVREVDIALMNDAEARQLFKTPSLIEAAKKILELDSKLAIIKKGEHGSFLYSKKGYFVVPGYPLEQVVDPTGCGDSFAGALIGWLAKKKDLSEEAFRKAIVYASTVASFNAEGFSLEKQKEISMQDIESRVGEFRGMVRF